MDVDVGEEERTNHHPHPPTPYFGYISIVSKEYCNVDTRVKAEFSILDPTKSVISIFADSTFAEMNFSPKII